MNSCKELIDSSPLGIAANASTTAFALMFSGLPNILALIYSRYCTVALTFSSEKVVVLAIACCNWFNSATWSGITNISS